MSDGIMVNEMELRKAISTIHPDGELFEVRIIGGRKPVSGYFRDADKLMAAFKTIDFRGCNAYVTLNPPIDAVSAREQYNCFRVAKQTTSDDEILSLDWLFIDLDPKRPSGISSNDAELELAHRLAVKIYGYMRTLGFEEPIKATSGNGYHLLYRIALKNTPENRKLVENALKTLSMMFSTDTVEVDTSNFNPSRICKLYGTMAQKGSDTSDRPHRMSRILGDMAEVKATSKAYLDKLVGEVPQEEVKPDRYNDYKPSEFDLEDWIREHGIGYTVKENSNSKKFVLDCCPFDSNHRAPDSMLFMMPSGAIGFKCLHNSCQGKTWRDVRLMYEPDAYDRPQEDGSIDAGWQIHKANRDREMDYSALDDKPTGPMWYTVKDILNLPEDKEVCIQTGITLLDKYTHGLAKGKVTLLTGLRGAAKSTIINQLMLSARQQGYNSICYSGELTEKNFAKWLLLQAAGKQNVVQSERFENYWYVPSDTKVKIADWIGDHIQLFNNDFGNRFELLLDNLKRRIRDTKADLIILDNLMALNIRELNPHDKYDAQSEFVNELCGLAKKADVHILFVAHPRKANGFLRLDDVSGSGDLSNRVDNALIIHRNNADFRRLSKEMFHFKDDEPMYMGTNVIEVVKDRDTGTQDLFIPLWYEKESKRLKNDVCENITYGWDQRDGWMKIDDEPSWALPFKDD